MKNELHYWYFSKSFAKCLEQLHSLTCLEGCFYPKIEFQETRNKKKSEKWKLIISIKYLRSLPTRLQLSFRQKSINTSFKKDTQQGKNEYRHVPTDHQMFKVNNRNNRTRCKTCSKLTIKTPKRRHWRRCDLLIGKSEHISHLALVFLLLTLSR